MSKQNNSVEKVVIDEESTKQFVESLYEDGRTPSDRFGLSHEDLGKLEDLYYGKWRVDEEPYELLKLYHMRADNMKNFEAAREFSAIKRYLKEKGYSSTSINNINHIVLNELEKGG